MARISEQLDIADHTTAIQRFIDGEGSHPIGATKVWMSTDFATGDAVLGVDCVACDRGWTLRMSSSLLNRVSNGYRDAVERQLAPFIARVVRAPCFKLTLEAELAEWLTLTVAAAMPLGVTYGQLIDEALRLHLCAPSQVDDMLEKLGFEGRRGFWVPGEPIHVRLVGSQVVNDGRITLPEGHPAHPGTTPATFTLEGD